MYQKLLKDIPGQVYTPPQLGTYYYAFNTQKGPTADQRVRLALRYDDRSPPDDRKSIRDGAKSQRGILHQMLPPDFTPEPSPFEQMSQEELNAQAKTL
ncbi:periplasmic murein peptide-binding protein [Escherichia coli]|nr:periplasmic murein peptide-binding protein [Escherichia coli]